MSAPATTAPVLASEIGRWVRGDGTRILLRADGTLWRCDGWQGDYALVRLGTTPEEARAYVEAEGGFVGRCQQQEAGRSAAARSKPLFVPQPTQGPPAAKRGASEPALTPEQRAEVDARVEAHAARVRQELERLNLPLHEDTGQWRDKSKKRSPADAAHAAWIDSQLRREPPPP